MESALTIEQKDVESIAIEPTTIYMDGEVAYENPEKVIEYGDDYLIVHLFIKVETEHTPETYFTPEYNDTDKVIKEIFSIRMEDENCIEIPLSEMEKEILINQIKNSITIK